MKRLVCAVLGLMAAASLLAGCGGMHPTGTIIGHVIFDRGNRVTAKTHGYGVVEILDSHGRVLQSVSNSY